MLYNGETFGQLIYATFFVCSHGARLLVSAWRNKMLIRYIKLIIFKDLGSTLSYVTKVLANSYYAKSLKVNYSMYKIRLSVNNLSFIPSEAMHFNNTYVLSGNNIGCVMCACMHVGTFDLVI